MKIAVLAAMLACGLASPALAQTRTSDLTADELLSMYRSSNAANRMAAGYWISGFVKGVVASSVHAGHEDGRPIICPNNAVVSTGRRNTLS
jgi:hypothetical protein